MTDRRAIVVGAGISGLVAALELERRGYDVHVLESAPFAGGVIRTVREEGYVFEAGPNSFPSTAAGVHSLAREVGIEGEIVRADPASETRLIYHRGKLLPVPTSAKDLLETRLFTFSQKLRIAAERFVPRRRHGEAETVAEFFNRRCARAPTPPPR